MSALEKPKMEVQLGFLSNVAVLAHEERAEVRHATLHGYLPMLWQYDGPKNELHTIFLGIHPFVEPLSLLSQ
jgi:hypothetical protein